VRTAPIKHRHRVPGHPQDRWERSTMAKTNWTGAKYPTSEEPGRNRWLTRFRGRHQGSTLSEVDMGTNENGEASMSRKRRDTPPD
jgi:hypothetical protein